MKYKSTLIFYSKIILIIGSLYLSANLFAVEAKDTFLDEEAPSIITNIISLMPNGSLGGEFLSPNITPEFYAVATDSQYAYALTDYYGSSSLYGGLWIVDFFTPGYPTLLNSGGFGSDYELIIQGDLAFLGGYGLYGSYGFSIVNVSNPTTPFGVSSLYVNGNVVDLRVEGNYAYLAVDYPLHGLVIVDISNIDNPVAVSVLENICFENGIEISGNYIYLTGACGFIIIDVSDPTNPIIVGGIGQYETQGCSEGTDIDIRGNVAFFTVNSYPGGSSGKICSADISDPTNPVILNSFTVQGDGAYDLVLAGSYGFIAEGTNGLRFMDFHNPNQLVSLALYDTPGRALDLALEGHNLYLADFDGGLFLYQLDFHSVSGRILDEDGLPVSGATIIANGLTESSTDANGNYTIDYLIGGSYVIAPTYPGHAFFPSSRKVNLPPDFNDQTFIMLPAPVSITLTPGTSTELSFLDSEGLETHITFPANAVSETMTIVLSPTVASYGPNFAFTGHAIEIAAYQDNLLLPQFDFNEPISVSIQYSDFDIRLISDENLLTIQQWVSNIWQDARESCVPSSAYIREVENNAISLDICETGKFALFGPTNPYFIPIIFKGN